MHWENRTTSSQLCPCRLKLGLSSCLCLCFALHNYSTGLPLAPGLIKGSGSKLLWQQTGYLTKWIFPWECIPEKRDIFFGIKEMLPFLFLSHGFQYTHTHIHNLGAEMPAQFLVLFMLRSVFHVTSSVLSWSSKWEGKWGCFTGKNHPGRNPGINQKKNE